MGGGEEVEGRRERGGWRGGSGGEGVKGRRERGGSGDEATFGQYSKMYTQHTIKLDPPM